MIKIRGKVCGGGGGTFVKIPSDQSAPRNLLGFLFLAFFCGFENYGFESCTRN